MSQDKNKSSPGESPRFLAMRDNLITGLNLYCWEHPINLLKAFSAELTKDLDKFSRGESTKEYDFAIGCSGKGFSSHIYFTIDPDGMEIRSGGRELNADNEWESLHGWEYFIRLDGGEGSKPLSTAAFDEIYYVFTNPSVSLSISTPDRYYYNSYDERNAAEPEAPDAAKEYSREERNAIGEVFLLCQKKEIDTDYAEKCLSQIDDVNMVIQRVSHPYIIPGYLYETTFLNEAVCYSNYEMVKLLLEHGADPNQFIDDGYVLWELHFIGDDAAEGEIRLKIAELLLINGANPNIIVDQETLYEYLMFELCNQSHNDDCFDYLRRFTILVVAYGAGSKSAWILRDIAKDRLEDYLLVLYECKDGYHLSPQIVDENGQTVAIL